MQIEEYIVNILRNEMGIPQSNIWIQSQNRKIPPESEELYCIVGVRFFDPISVKSRWIPETAQEEQVFYGRADVQIDLLSRSNEARIRRSEILMALNSFYSKNFQDEKCFRIFKIPTSFINTSDLQGGSDINRFTLIIPTMISEKKIVGFDYYDKFRMSVQDEKSIIANINEQNYTFTIKPVPEDAIVTINGVEQKSIYTYGDVNWKVEKPDYKSEEGNLFLTKDTVYNVTLQQMATLTVLPDPEDAIVKINNIEQTSITVPVGTVVKVEVSKSGYETKIENIVVDEDKSINIVLENVKVTFTIIPTPSDAEVKLNNIVQSSIEVNYGDTVAWEVSKDGYTPQSGITSPLLTNTELPINLAEIIPVFTFTINPTPSEAIVTINEEQTRSVTVEEGTKIIWSVTMDNYTPQNGELVVTQDTTLDITLEKISKYKYVWTGDAAADGVTFEAYNSLGEDVLNLDNYSTCHSETNLEILNVLYSWGENNPTTTAWLNLYKNPMATYKFCVKFKDKIILKTIKLRLSLDASVPNKYIGLFSETDEYLGSILSGTSEAVKEIRFADNANKEINGFYVIWNNETQDIKVTAIYIEAEN